MKPMYLYIIYTVSGPDAMLADKTPELSKVTFNKKDKTYKINILDY